MNKRNMYLKKYIWNVLECFNVPCLSFIVCDKPDKGWQLWEKKLTLKIETDCHVNILLFIAYHHDTQQSNVFCNLCPDIKDLQLQAISFRDIKMLCFCFWYEKIKLLFLVPIKRIVSFTKKDYYIIFFIILTSISINFFFVPLPCRLIR